MKNPFGILVLAILGILGSIWMLFVFSLIASIPLYFLWNWLMPLLFQVPSLTLLQAVGVAWLSAILFRNQTTVKHEKAR